MIEAKLNKIERAVKGSKLARLLYNPIGYIMLIFVKYFLSYFKPYGLLFRIKTIFHFNYQVRLPSNAEFLVFKCKSSLSDIRLIRYFLQTLKAEDFFIDVGANYGFYSLLAATKIGTQGRIIAIEPTKDSFDILKLNTEKYLQINAFNVLGSDDNKEYVLYEFQAKHVEYNTIFLDPFLSMSKWYRANPPLERRISGVILDQFLAEHNVQPSMIKIDTENSDFKILSGLEKTILHHYPDFILRLWNQHRNNQIQLSAIRYLLSKQYVMYGINQDGTLFPMQINELYQYPFEDIILKSSQKQKKV